MKYAVFSQGNKQYKVSEGQEIVLDRLNSKSGEEIKFDNILLYVDGDDVKLGNPAVSGAQVLASIIGDEKGEKIRVVKYKAKSRYRRVMGHRSSYTRVKIEKITPGK
ncbi:MAG: 50S ribosomal protein L21 [Candidatus Blackburnbacteria bacterium]|nr:50S ribosomal protein L21 [Candidatus Blackburnbacteria bacterium]